VLAPGYFARQDTRTPVRIGIQALGLNMGLNLAIVLPLALINDRPGLHALLALNNGIGAWYNSTMLYRGLRRSGVLRHGPGWKQTLGQVVAANIVMIAFLWWLAGDTQRWLDMGAWQRVGWMSLLVVGGGAAYFGTLYLLGMRVRHLRVQAPPRLPEPTTPADPPGPAA
jgi:putative peptidoglycan lipid II flippase